LLLAFEHRLKFFFADWIHSNSFYRKDQAIF